MCWAPLKFCLIKGRVSTPSLALGKRTPAHQYVASVQLFYGESNAPVRRPKARCRSYIWRFIGVAGLINPANGLQLLPSMNGSQSPRSMGGDSVHEREAMCCFGFPSIVAVAHSSESQSQSRERPPESSTSVTCLRYKSLRSLQVV